MINKYNIIHTYIMIGDMQFNITITERSDINNESIRWIAEIDDAMEYAYGPTADSALTTLENKIRKMLSIFG